MELKTDDIIRTCREVHRLSRIADWRWKGMPVIQWEFLDISQFGRAKMDLLSAIGPMMMHTRNEAEWQRNDGPEICEIDCHGVTFRLVCKQRLAVAGRATAVGAAEMVFRKLDHYTNEPKMKLKDAPGDGQ